MSHIQQRQQQEYTEETVAILVQDKFGFRRERGITDKVVMQRKMSEQSLDVEEEGCTCFIHCLKAFDGVNWAKETPRV
jgi:hypothetical protein